MFYFIELLIYFILFFYQTNGINDEIFLFNDPTYKFKIPYRIVSSNHRIKRDQSTWFLPEIDKDQISCGYNVYVKLNTCSYLTECRSLSSCFESLHCPLHVKSFGSLLVNLLNLLEIENCNANQICSHEKRLIILQKSLTHWNKNHDENYCSTISKLINEVKREVQEQCPTNLTEVETLIENYLCSNLTNEIEKSSNHFLTTTLSPQLSYIDEDNDLKFINTNKNFYNNTEQKVYVNDHQYYNVSYIVPKFSGVPIHYVLDKNEFVRIHALSNRHRAAFGINLKFPFPFYGHTINKILVATGGFIYTGDLLHSALIGSTQYIAPFMANFDASIGNNETEIKYYDNGTHFVCTWNEVYLQDQQDVGPFTFQAILQNTGNIYFNYLQIPKVKISNINHAHRIGLSDAYMSQHTTNEHVVRVITLYDKINLDKEKIQNGVSVIFEMDQTCNTFTDCSSCLANRGKRYNCSWCVDIQKCSDGYDRSRQQWIRSQCHRFAMKDTCPNNIEDIFDNNHFLSTSLPSMVHFEKQKQTNVSTPRQHSIFQTFRTIFLTLLLSVLFISLLALGITYIYAYRNPTSPAGMWLLEHRPTNYIARFKRFTGSN